MHFIDVGPLDISGPAEVYGEKCLRPMANEPLAFGDKGADLMHFSSLMNCFTIYEWPRRSDGRQA